MSRYSFHFYHVGDDPADKLADTRFQGLVSYHAHRLACTAPGQVDSHYCEDLYQEGMLAAFRLLDAVSEPLSWARIMQSFALKPSTANRFVSSVNVRESDTILGFTPPGPHGTRRGKSLGRGRRMLQCCCRATSL